VPSDPRESERVTARFRKPGQRSVAEAVRLEPLQTDLERSSDLRELFTTIVEAENPRMRDKTSGPKLRPPKFRAPGYDLVFPHGVAYCHHPYPGTLAR
jgi:hypothetical protein